jgi:hypothetical protein
VKRNVSNSDRVSHSVVELSRSLKKCPQNMYGIRSVSEDVTSRLLQQEVCTLQQHILWDRTTEMGGSGGTADGTESENTDRRRKCLLYRPLT